MDFIVDKAASVDRILSCVKQHGVCVLPDYLSATELTPLRTEFDRIIARDNTGDFREHACRGYIDALTASDEVLEASPFTAIRDLVTRPVFEAITEGFYGDDYIYTQKTYIVQSTQTPDGADELPYCMHFDKLHMLKFFFLLGETDQECGPTWIVPGLQRDCYMARKDWKDRGGDVQKIENTLRGLDDRAIPLTGRAGTLAVVDTDVPHKAGKVIGGKARKVIRIDTTSPSYSGFEWKRQPKGGFFSRIMRNGSHRLGA